jgi:hypothetical protein
MSGAFHGKMIVVQALMDEAAYPWGADWYRARVKAALGPAFEDRYRLWFVENAMHVTQAVAPNDPRPVASTRVVSYQGVLQQALRDLAAWVERGVAPPPSTSYSVDDGQVVLPASAQVRGGVQPVVRLTIDGADCATVQAGEAVAFEAAIDAPPGAGVIAAAEWDFEGDGSFPVKSEWAEPSSSATVRQTHAFATPGVYFPAVRVASRRADDVGLYAQPKNIGRVRVVVQ